MNLRDLLKPQSSDLIVSGVNLVVKKLNWKELNEFQAFAEHLEKQDETKSAVELCKFIFERFIKDKETSEPLTSNEVEELPVDFCIELLNQFLAKVKGEQPTTEDIKKN